MDPENEVCFCLNVTNQKKRPKLRRWVPKKILVYLDTMHVFNARDHYDSPLKKCYRP